MDSEPRSGRVAERLVRAKVTASMELLQAVTVRPTEVSKADIDRVRAAGVSDAAIEDALRVAFLFNVLNRLANALGLLTRHRSQPTTTSRRDPSLRLPASPDPHDLSQPPVRARAGRSHSPTDEGLIEAPTVWCRSAMTASSATSSRSRSTKASTVRWASYVARSKRRSTTRCTSRRSGWNSAAATRVETATATVSLGEPGQHRLERDHAPGEHRDEHPVTTAQAMVRLMIRSIS